MLLHFPQVHKIIFEFSGLDIDLPYLYVIRFLKFTVSPHPNVHSFGETSLSLTARLKTDIQKK